MSCRQSRLSSAIVTLVRDMTGLSDSQVLALHHALMREVPRTTAATADEWNAAISTIQSQFADGTLTRTAGSRGIEERLTAARSENPDARRIHATLRLLERARQAAEAQTTHLTGYARDTAIDYPTAQAAFRRFYDSATADAHLEAPAAFTTAWANDPDHHGLLVDRRSTYAYWQMSQARDAFRSTQAAVPAVMRERVESSAIAEIGYNPATQRAEVVLHSNPEVPYAYRMSPQQYAEFRNAPSIGSYYSRHIRSNPAFRYASSDDATAEATRVRCATCGQFADTAHSCPVPGSPTQATDTLLADITNAATALREQRLATPAAPTTPAQDEIAALAAVAAAPRVGVRGQTVRYDGTTPDGTTVNFRLPGLTRLRPTVRANGMAVVAVFASTVDEHGNNRVVTGDVLVGYDPATRAWTATVHPGLGDRSLRCYCQDYRDNYRCEHIDRALSALPGLLADRTARRVTYRQAWTTHQNNLNNQYQASVAATTTTAAAFVPLATSFETEPEKFQALYEEARAKRAAFASGQSTDYPVPYLRENVLGGMAQRGSGRGFGIEVEFSFPQTMSYAEQQSALREIGRELYEAGLTTTAHQQGYGASHGRYRDQHTRGWSFESDGSTGGADGSGGGEIVSPVMFDEAETWTNIEKVSEILRRHGAFASRGSGMHCHVGVGDYDHRLDNHNRLLNAFHSNEDLLYRLSTNPDRGSHRGRTYCAPNFANAASYASVDRVRGDHSSHGIGLNFQSVSGRGTDHVEFRTFDATLRPEVMQAQIAMAVFLAEGATRPGTAETIPAADHSRVGTRLAANPRRNALEGDAWTASTLGFRRFLDRFVPGTGTGDDTDNPRVKQLVSLFALTKWQR